MIRALIAVITDSWRVIGRRSKWTLVLYACALIIVSAFDAIGLWMVGDLTRRLSESASVEVSTLAPTEPSWSHSSSFEVFLPR